MLLWVRTVHMNYAISAKKSCQYNGVLIEDKAKLI